MRIFIVLILSLVPFTLFAQSSTVLLGKVSELDLTKEPYATWFDKGRAEYSVQADLLNELGEKLKDKTLKVYFGTWCGDSKREIPRLIRLLDELGFSKDKVELIAVNNAPKLRKTTPEGLEKGAFIYRVPTIIVLSNGKELGRIIESPVNSLEKDLLAILNGQYLPNYQAYSTVAQWDQEGKLDEEKADMGALASQLAGKVERPSELSAVQGVLSAQLRTTAEQNVAYLNYLLFPENKVVLGNFIASLQKGGKDKVAKKTIRKYRKRTGDQETYQEFMKNLSN